MILRYLKFGFLSLILLAGCKDSSTGAGENEQATGDGLAVRAVNTGSEDLELETDSEANIDFCYEGDGCADTGGQSFHLVYAGESSLVDYSVPDKKAVGVTVGINITKGTGYFEVISGRPYRDDAGFLEFEEGGEVLYTSDTFSAGETARFQTGDTGSQ